MTPPLFCRELKILLLDNYDSFTYNLLHLAEKVGSHDIDVRRNDAVNVEDAVVYDRIILSPGPGLPRDAGIMPALISKYHKSKPILGICLGLQAIGEHFGTPLRNLASVCHGVALPVHVKSQDPLFENCPETFMAGRYHSWVLDEEKISEDLEVIAVDDEGLIMAARHREFNICGVQFHPESILSEYGEAIMGNWLRG